MHQEVKNKTNIKLIKLINGDDIVCHLPEKDSQLPDNSPLLRLEKPLQVKYIPQFTTSGFRDYIALIRWVNFSPDNIITIPKDKIMTIAGATKEMAGQYNIISKEYHSLRPPKQNNNYEAKQLDNIDQKKIRELFEEFDDEDEDKTIH
tara:strand:- start:2816 stop:3259 length:444 start_codon:yes stop_codon:yes gene_type:complete